MTRLPDGFNAIAAEVAPGLAGLYGMEAGAAYLSNARRAMANQLENEDALVLGAYIGGELAGMLAGVQRGDLGEIAFIHVRSEFRGRGVDAALALEAVRAFRGGGSAGIVFECVAFCPLDLAAVLPPAGFELVPRELMWTEARPLAVGARGDSPVVALTEKDWPEASACIIDAYRGHPGRRLHYEVRDLPHTADFVSRVAAGRYGSVIGGGLLGVRGENGWDGVLAGCEVAPGVGFVLQLAVRRAMQGRGIGTALMRGAARRFSDAGMKRVALGVSVSDPAHTLYARLGFQAIRAVDAYIWWRPDYTAPSSSTP